MIKHVFVIIAILAAPMSAALAAVSVGSKPEMKFHSATTGGDIDLAKLKGKIVVIDFWATWCGPCMAEAGHMVELNQKYAPQGLQMIGVSLDDNAGALKNIVKEKNFTWPQYFDGRGWQNKYAQMFGVDSIPRTFIVGPDGAVLWTGHPGAIDEPLASAFKEHPPQLVDPKLVEAAQVKLEEANAAAKTGDNAGAIKALATIPPDARKDAGFSEKSAKALEQLAPAADAALAQAETLITQKKFGEASAKLTEISNAFAGQPAGDKAAKRLREVNAMPEARAQIAAAERSAKADAALASAQQLKEEQKDIAAYPAFKSVVATFPGTDAAAKASEIVKAYESDKDFMKKFNDAVAGPKAKSALSMADSYKRAGRADLAKKKYQSVIEQYPNTEYAEKAQKALDEMK